MISNEKKYNQFWSDFEKNWTNENFKKMSLVSFSNLTHLEFSQKIIKSYSAVQRKYLSSIYRERLMSTLIN